ncbi:hypothetical protein F4824DRAFT_6230 [Ustulina deusta]|nr:hypothetical protein F4824DRAFT_6230 [Ustulina deusta]
MSVQPNRNTVTIDGLRSSPPPAPPDVVKITNAPEDIVRAVLIALCHDPLQEQKAMAYFAKLEGLRSKLNSEGINAGAGTGAETGDVNLGESNEERNGGRCTNAKGSNKRRAISDIRICELCKEPFREDDNPSDACRHHPGNLDVNEEASVWEDWEDWRDGDQDSEESKTEYPEGYIWDCCQRSGESAGCALGSHEGSYKKPYAQSMIPQ